MNTLLVTSGEVTTTCKSPRATVRGPRAKHLVEELDVRPGTRVRAGLVDDRLGWAEVISCGRDEVEVALDLTDAPPAKLPLTLVVGLPRPKAARRLLVDATAAGVERIVLLGTWRTPKSYWQSPLLTAEAIETSVRQGLAIAGDCVRPRVDARRRFKPFVEDELPAILAHSDGLVALPDASERAASSNGPIALCIGPERGFTQYESHLLVQTGCRPISLGARTLRVHAAVHVAVGRLF